MNFYNLISSLSLKLQVRINIFYIKISLISDKCLFFVKQKVSPLINNNRTQLLYLSLVRIRANTYQYNNNNNYIHQRDIS